MNQIVSFNDKITQDVFLKRFQHLAGDMAAEMGVDLGSITNHTNSNNSISFSLVFKVKNSKSETKVHKTGPIMNDEIVIGFKFILKGSVYEVVGFKASNWKNPILITRQDGKRFKISYDGVCKSGRRYNK